MKPAMGQIVIFKLNEQAATEINRRRTTSDSIRERMKPVLGHPNGQWHPGAQAHIGNPVIAGEEFPMVIVRVEPGPSLSDPMALGVVVNGQVLLDGNDTYWTRFVIPGDKPGQWRWAEPSGPTQICRHGVGFDSFQ